MDPKYENDRDSLDKAETGKQLWETLRAGKRDGLAELFDRYYSSLYDYGVKIIADGNFVKDSIQKLFLKLWDKRDSLDSPKSVKAYLLVSLRRILLRKKKQKKNRYQRNGEYLKKNFETNFSKEDLIIQEELEDEKKEILVEAINQLSGKQKEALFLRYYHGLTNKEIAEVMDINYQSVKNNIYRAIKNIKGMVPSIRSMR